MRTKHRSKLRDTVPGEQAVLTPSRSAPAHYPCLQHMQIQINTDTNIEGNEAFADHVRNVVEKHLKHYADQLSRVEVHMGDMNAEKTGQHDHSCTMEARPKGLDPLAATYKAANSHDAVEGAANSLLNLLRTRFGKLDERKGAAKLPFKNESV